MPRTTFTMYLKIFVADSHVLKDLSFREAQSHHLSMFASLYNRNIPIRSHLNVI